MMKSKIILSLVMAMFVGSVQAANVGETAPSFALKDLKQANKKLEDYKGKIVFVNFWATWCAPCNVEFPELSRLAEEFKDRDVQVIAVNIDKKQDVVEKFLAKMKSTSNALLVLLDPASDVVAKYDVEAMPSSYIIDKAGKIRFVHVGFHQKDPEKWRQEIMSLKN